MLKIGYGRQGSPKRLGRIVVRSALGLNQILALDLAEMQSWGFGVGKET